MFKNFFKKKKKVSKRPTSKQAEARKMAIILQNIVNYDGTSRGQQDVR